MPQDQQSPSPEAKGFGRGYQYVALGFTFAGAILFFGWLGWLLDKWLNLRPLFTIVGTFLGGGAGFYRIYRQVMADTAKDKGEPGAGSREP
jgi:F0F1-type ATP synthase assembly protein I